MTSCHCEAANQQLDVGGGGGVLHHTLLDRGFARAWAWAVELFERKEVFPT